MIRGSMAAQGRSAEWEGGDGRQVQRKVAFLSPS